MARATLSGSDTVTINNRTLADFADGNCIELTYPDDIANVKTGKNNNSVYGYKATGLNAEVKIRLVRGGNDDQFLLNLFNQQGNSNNFSGTVLLSGTFIKKLGDGAGNVSSDTYILSGGIFLKGLEGRTNAEGETEQSIVIYGMKFASAIRVIS